MKYCKRCDRNLPISDFYNDKRTNTPKSECKECSLERLREYRKRNPAKMKEAYARKNLKRKPYIAFKKNHCEQCGFIAVHSCQLDVDHIDGVHVNNDINNLRTLCANCHRLKTHLNNDYQGK